MARRFTRRRERVKSEINVTPLVDVMMCLLVIFMITAPLLTSGIPLNLPRGDGKGVETPEKIVDISITDKGEIFVGQTLVSEEKLLRQVSAIVKENPRIRMMISGDRGASYGQVIEVMALLRSAGFTQVALKTDATSVIKAPAGKRK